MNFIELILLSIALAMDTFAVSICISLSRIKKSIKTVIIPPAYFGVFQAGMPLIGFILASLFTVYIVQYSSWIAFIILAFIGGKMIYGSFKADDSLLKKDNILSPAFLLPLAIATSIDALAVGVSFAALETNIILAVMLIGSMTFIIASMGILLGSLIGIRFKSKAEILGGIVLVLIGIRILI